MKKSLTTINSEIALDPNNTFGSLVRTINKHSDARFVDSKGMNYDFKNNKVKTLIFTGKKFEEIGFEIPKADLWIFYSDGYSTDTKNLGYSKPTEYHETLMSFLEKQVFEGNVKRIINTPEAERKTLKKYFAQLNPEEYGIIPTYILNNSKDLLKLLEEKKKIVFKPDWGGGMKGIKLISSLSQIKNFSEEEIKEGVFQDYHPGDEKRMWLVGGKFVDGRIIKDRHTPWENKEGDNLVYRYNKEEVMKNGWNLSQLYKEIELVNKLAKKTNLEIGSIDFLGNRINEINGAGTGFTTSNRSNDIHIDAREFLNEYIKSLLI